MKFDASCAEGKPEMRSLSGKRLYLLDMDGTLYLGERPLPGAARFLRTIRESGARYCYMSNNSSRGTDAYIAKLKRMGIEARPEEFLTSVDAAIDLLRKEQPGKKGFVLGTASMLGQLKNAGLSVSGEEPEGADYVLVGFDRELTYRKLEDVCRLLAERPDIPYYATNPDWVCPTEFGSVPDCGSICEMIFRATGCRPKVIGKPEKYMAELAMRRFGASPEETAVVGDRIYTDIAGGVNAGVDSIFVLSGEGVPEDIERYGFQPTWIFATVADAADAIAAETEETAAAE